MTGPTILLPPSETKREGGDESRSLDLGALTFPELTGERVAAMAAARSVSSDDATARRALGLGVRNVGERLRNLSLDRAPALPAIERYTGVLYDPLEAGAAPAATRRWWAEHVIVQSAMFGPIGAGDLIPAYRLSHDSRLPGVRLATLWTDPAARALATRDGLVVDLRSEGYRALAPMPHAVAVRVVSEDADGRRKALNHWNKTAKGRFVAALGADGPSASSMGELAEWARFRGIVLEVVDGVWELVAESLVPALGAVPSTGR